MKPVYHFFVLGSLLCLLSCTSLQKLKLQSVPVFTDQTSWMSRQYSPDLQQEDLSVTYTTQMQEMTATHYLFSVRPKDQVQSAYTIRLRRSDLAVDGFISAQEKELKVYLPLLRFPLQVGQSWQDSLRIQEHPRSPVKEIPAVFEVKKVEAVDYLPNEELGAEKKAFLILLHLPDRILNYHYIPPTKKFPGTNLIDLYLQLDLSNPNGARLTNEVLEYSR